MQVRGMKDSDIARKARASRCIAGAHHPRDCSSGRKPPPPAAAISRRVDADDHDWFPSQRPGCPMRVNAILRADKEEAARARG